MIELRTLGALELTAADGRAVGSVLAQPRRAALLCYLAVASPRGFHRRDTLLALFWPEHDAEQARRALRQSVYFLRRALGPDAIVSRGDDELAVAPEAVHCDVRAFEAALEEGRADDALALYAGELLAGFHISDAPDFERWLDGERSRLRERAQEAAWALAGAREEGGDPAGAAEAARRAVALAPADEIVLRRQLLLLERLGDRAGAVRAYEAFAGRLREEYELEPSGETEQLVARIRAEPGGRPPSVAPPAVPPARLVAESPSSVSRPRQTWRLVAAGVAATALLALAGVRLQAGWPGGNEAAPAPPAGEPPAAIAVLPFALGEAVPAGLHEGLMDLVAMNLAGIESLHAVDSRSLMARWREGTGGTVTPPLDSALEVARRAGGRYAVVSRVIAAGGDLIVTAGVHDVLERRTLGTARSRAPADSIFGLVDHLTLEILGLIPRDRADALAPVELTRVNTASLPALKAYMEGEALFRRVEFERAAEAYGRAIEADSAFALAHYRLGLSRQWFWDHSLGPTEDPMPRAVGSFGGRLPPHEAAMLRAIELRDVDAAAARGLLEEEARRHPLDVETWYQLGDFYYHLGAQALVQPGAAERALSKAIALDSSFTPTYIHRLEYAFRARDTATGSRLLEAFSRMAPKYSHLSLIQLLSQLTFGDPAARTAAVAALETLETGDLHWAAGILADSRQWPLADQALRTLRDRGERTTPATVGLLFSSLARGQADRAARYLDDPLLPDFAKPAMIQGIADAGAPGAVRGRGVALPLDADSTDVVLIFYGGSAAATQGRWPLVREAVERLASRAPRLRAAGDSAEAGYADAVRQGLEGYALWRQGDPEHALPLLQAAQRGAHGSSRRALLNATLRWWVARLLLEMDRPRDALPYLESLAGHWLPADYERGRVYERLGKAGEAREAYAQFLAPRGEVDAVFRPMVEEARAAVATAPAARSAPRPSSP